MFKVTLFENVTDIQLAKFKYFFLIFSFVNYI